jgi:hypothetical protein
MSRNVVQHSPEAPLDPTAFLVYRQKCSCARANASTLFVTETLYTIDSVDRDLRLARTRREARICYHTISEHDNRRATLAVFPLAVADDPETLAHVVEAVLRQNGNAEESNVIIDSIPSHLYLGDALEEEHLRRAFLAGATTDEGDEFDDGWWEAATRRWRQRQWVDSRPTSVPNRIAAIADELRAGGLDERGLAHTPVPINVLLARSIWLFDLCRWAKAEGDEVTVGTVTVLAVHSGVEFLLVVHLQRPSGDVCEAVALLPHNVGMNLPKLARLVRQWLATSPHRGLPQSAEELEPAVISKERFRRAVAGRRRPQEVAASLVGRA